MGKYITITGHGRSGTKSLLSLLDICPSTHCRNSPYLDPTAPLSQLPSRFVHRSDLPALADGWDEAMVWTASHMGAGDQRIPVVKHHLHGLSCRLGLPAVMYYTKLRRLVALVSPSLRRMEWPVPAWLGKQKALASALPVLRTSQVPGWVCWALAHRPAACVLHIVRHPGGFLNSWRNRFLRDRDAVAVHTANLARLQEVAAADTAWAQRFGAIERLSLEESELWYWRYATEEIHATGVGSSQYKLVIYEQLAANPVAVMREVYASCGLDWGAAIERAIVRSARESQQLAGAWRQRLDAGEVARVEGILHNSPMQGWWEGAKAVDEAHRVV